MRKASVLVKLLTVVVVSGLAASTPRHANAAPPEVREARDWLAFPKGSTSLGLTSGGRLVGAAELPPKGVGYQVLSHAVGRKTNFGTSELVLAIASATKVVREKFPGSMLGVGNLGFENGEEIPWSVSHQAGRDGDIGMYATTLDGTPVDLKGPMVFHYFDQDGIATGSGGRKVRFDVRRNLALVVALAEDAEARVQYLFVAAWLKEKLLAEAKKAGVKADTVARLAELMHQPTDSNPHADHFHVRLFCTIEDRLYGCINRGPVRAWVDPGDREHAEAARRIASILELTGKGSEALHVRALERLSAMKATSALEAVARTLSAPSKKVRKAGLATLVALGDPAAAEHIVKVLPAVEDAGWATELFLAIPELDAGTLVPLAEKALAPGGVEALLHPKALKAGAKVRIAALEVLRDHGAPAHVPTLLAYAEDKERGVKKAALDALSHRTCRSLKNAGDYRAWLANAAKEPELVWVESGLGGKKVFPSGLRTKDGVAKLIRMLDKGNAAVRGCALRGLVALTGHDEDPRLRTPGRNRKHWESWWADNQVSSGLP